MWGVPASHEIFNELNSAQWLWYFYNFSKDQEEGFIKQRDMTEYLASFIQPEAVKKIRDARDKTIQMSDKDFDNMLHGMFGKGLDNIKHKGIESTTSADDVVKNFK